MKKRISLAAVFAVLLSIAVFAVPSFETVENSSEITQNATAVLNDTGVFPGINVLTGTTEVKTFESFAENTDYLTNSGYAPGFNNTGIASATIVKKGNSNALYIRSASGAYPFFRWKMPTTFEAGRPVYVSVNAQTTSNANFWFIGMQHATASNKTENLVFNPNNLSWHNASTLIVGSTTGKFTKKSFSAYSSQAISQLGFQAEKSGGMYLDALAFIPYYKISYYAPDGSVLDTAYALLDENGAFLTAYTPNTSLNPYGDALKGWATAPGGAVTNSVTLNHADISLYAVIDTTGLAEITYDANKPALAEAVTGLPASTYATPDASFTLSAAKLSASYFVFKGWSLEKKAVADYTEADLVSAVTPNSTDALTVYAVWDYDYSASSMKSVEFGGNDEDAILDALYTDRTLTYSKFSLADGLGVYTPNAKMGNYDRYSINIGAKYTDGVSADYNRIVLRARLSSITNQAAMALQNTAGTALTSSGDGVIWLTTTGKNDSNKANWNTKELQEYSQTRNAKVTGAFTQFKVDALRKAPNAADTSDSLQSANIDYIRFYRTGDKTVTYHLNDGTQDIFMADSKAAVGVGYRLTGEVPTRTGFEFRGWATSQADAKTETNLLSPSASIAIVNQNVDLYACWLDKRPSTLGLEFDEDSAILSKIFSDAGAGSYADIHFTADGTVAFQANKDVPSKTHPTYAVSFEAKYPDGIPVEYNRCTFRAKLSPLSLSGQNLMCLTTDAARSKGILTESNSPILWFKKNGKVTYDYIEKSGSVQNVSAPLKTAYLNVLRTGQKAVSDINDSAFVDYIRFYRTGDKTVTYYLNDGTQNAFQTDTQAAVGTDYRLTGDQPTRDGYTFLGWGLREDATSTVAAIDITNTSANNLYALWQPNETVPTMIEKTSIRVNGQSGIRFAAKVNLSAKNDEKTEEIGFIIGRKDQLEKKDASLNNLVFGADGPQEKGRTPDGVKYVYGVAYNKAGVNIVYDDNGTKFDGITQGENEAVTCVITGITNVNTSLAVRSYVKYDGLYYYSTAFARSLYETAQSMNEKYNSLSDEEKAKVDEILGTTGGSDNA